VPSDKCSFDFSFIESYKCIAGVKLVKIDVNLYSNKVIKQIKNANQL
jgi:hypothetical protein